MTPSERWLRRLYAFVQRLHAPRHVRRHGSAIDRLLDEMLRRAPNGFERRTVLRRALRDGLSTLWLTWRDELGWLCRPARIHFKRGWNSMGNDISFALRFHRRQPIYALVVVATLALAVGANTAIYTIAQAALFRTLPYEEPDRIVEVQGRTSGLQGMTQSYDFRTTQKFETAAGIQAAGLYIAGGGANLETGSPARRLQLTTVSANFFEIVGVEMTLGAGLSGATESDVAVIGHSLWTQSFGADPAILGRTIRLSGRPYRVVGVAPSEVRFPGNTEVWVRQPALWDFYSDALGPTLIARLGAGVDRREAEALLQVRTQEDRAETDGTHPPRLVPLRDVLTTSVRAPLIILMGAAAMVFLLGCLNLAGVAVSRLIRRSGELQIRVALGAGRARVFRQLIIEALVLGAFGGVAGLIVAAGGVRLLLAWLPGEVPGLSTARIGMLSTLLAGGLAALASLLVNSLPALRMVRKVHVSKAARTATEDRRQVRLRSGLCIAQVCVALLLVVAAGLLGKSLVRVARTPLGIDVDSVLLFETHLTHVPQDRGEGDEAYSARLKGQRDLYLRRVESRLAGLPGVLGVGAVSQLPLSHDMGIVQHYRTPETSADATISAQYLEATAGYFDAIGIRFVAGRSFFAPDARVEEEAVVSRKAAEALFGSSDALGQEILQQRGIDDWKPFTVVGVVEDVRIHGPDAEPRPAVYISTYDSIDLQLGFAVRTAGAPGAIVDRVTGTLAEIAAGVPAYEVRTSRQALSRELASRRALAIVSILFAGTALLLASVGIYGLISESVASTRREIGIRMALGAPAHTLVAKVAGRGVLLAAAGTLIAVPLSFWGGRFLESQLEGVSIHDPMVLGSAPLVLIIVASLAAWLPARRASRVAPVEVLSTE